MKVINGTFFSWILCHVLREHDWTGLALEGKPVPDHLRPVAGDGMREIRIKFQEFARMYCRRCGKYSRLTP